MKQLNLLNSPSKGINLKSKARLENGIRKMYSKEKVNKLQAIFKNGVASSGKIDCVKRQTQAGTSIVGGFHEAISPILVMAQCFGVMPVTGVKCKSASMLKFQWKSVRVAYSFVAFLLALIYAVMTVGKTLSREIQFDRMSKFAFYFHYTLH